MSMINPETTRQGMVSGYRRMFWGVLLMLFHINIGPIQVLPKSLGYIIIASGIGCIKRAADTRVLGRASLAVVWCVTVSLMDFAQPFVGDVFAISRPVALLTSGVTAGIVMVLFYDIFRASARLLRDADAVLAADTDRCTRTFLVLHTIVSLGSLACIAIPNTLLMIAVAIIGLLVQIWLAAVFAGLKRRYAVEGVENEDPPEEES